METDNIALARRYGQMLMAGAGISGILYLFGLLRRSYWALALPLTSLVGAALVVTLLLGRLLATTPDEPPDPR